MALPTAADIALGTREQQVQKVEDATIRARYPNAARDDAVDPPAGYFDLVADADTVLAARKALLGVERRRFAVEVDGLIWFDPLQLGDDGQLKNCVHLVDADHAVDITCMVTRWQIDLENETTLFELMG